MEQHFANESAAQAFSLFVIYLGVLCAIFVLCAVVFAIVGRR
jgi:hypothetical protein